jgi:tyrosine-protein kinase Etk/Wzc
MTIPTLGFSNILLRLASYRWFISIFSLVFSLVAGLVASFSAPIFTAYARLLPPQTNSATASTLLNQVGGSATLGASALTIKNPSDLYASLFMSRSIQDDVIERFKLAEHYEETDADKLRLLVARRTRVDVGRDGIITLAYTDKTSERSANVANGMIDAMYRIAQRLARDEAERRLKFYEGLIEEMQKKLMQSDQKLLEQEQKTGLTRLRGQEEASVAAASELRGLIATRQVDLTKMLITGTHRHPQVIRLQAELRAYEVQLRRLENKKNDQDKYLEAKTADGISSDEQGLFVSFKEYAKKRTLVEPLRREVEINNKVLDQLLRAQALSRIDESRDLSVIQVLDSASPPTNRSGPRPLLNAAVGALIGFLISLAIALVWDLLFTTEERKTRWRKVMLSMLGRYENKTLVPSADADKSDARNQIDELKNSADAK